MRMGKPNKRRKSRPKGGSGSGSGSGSGGSGGKGGKGMKSKLLRPNGDKYMALSPSRMGRHTEVGRVSLDVITSVLWVELLDRAERSVEDVARLYMEYDDAMSARKRMQQQKQQQQQQLLWSNGTTTTTTMTTTTTTTGEGKEVDGGVGGDDDEEKDGVRVVEVDAEGTTTMTTDGDDDDKNASITDDGGLPPLPPLPNRHRVIFSSNQSIDDLLDQVLRPTAAHFGPDGDWKVHANAAKFERLLDEKYGPFRPFVDRHPEIERFVRTVQRNFAKGRFSPFRPSNDAPLAKNTSVVLLFMLHRNGVRWDALLLVALFLLVGLQPWALVALVALGRNRMMSRKRSRAVGGFKDDLVVLEPYYAPTRVYDDNDDDDDNDNNNDDNIDDHADHKALDEKQDAEVNAADAEKKRRNDLLRSSVGTHIAETNLFQDDKDTDDNTEESSLLYDVVVLGTGTDVLYTAALLSRTGKSVLVLSEDGDASGCRILSHPEQAASAARALAARAAEKASAGIGGGGGGGNRAYTTTTASSSSSSSSNPSPSTPSNDKDVGTRWSGVPFDVCSTNVSNVQSQQRLLAPALCTYIDVQGGIRFARVGTEADGYAHAMLCMPGVGLDENAVLMKKGKSDVGVPFILRGMGGLGALAHDASIYLGDGWVGHDGKVENSSSSLYVKTCRVIQSSASEFYLSKILPESVYALRSKTSYQESSIRYAQSFLDKFLPLNAHVRSLMAAVGMRDENVPPGRCSMAAHVTNVCAAIGMGQGTGEDSDGGMCYPVGGPRALCRALEGTVIQCGGKVVTGAVIKELVFEKNDDDGAGSGDDNDDDDDGGGGGDKKGDGSKDHRGGGGGGSGSGSGGGGDMKPKKKKKKSGNGNKANAGEEEGGGEEETNKDDGQSGQKKPRCVGVMLSNKRTIRVHPTHGAVISNMGFIPTFVRLVPDDVRLEHGVPRGLPALSERRPLIRVLVGLAGSADELCITGADFYRLPNARIARDSVDQSTGQVRMGEIGSDGGGNTFGGDNDAEEGGEGEEGVEAAAVRDIDATSASATDEGGGGGAFHRGKRLRSGGRRHKFDRGVSWMKISFPSAKDPSWCERYPDITTCVVTVEAEDEFVTMYDTKPKVFAIHPKGKWGGDATSRLMDKVLGDLVDHFPQLEGKIECAELCAPYRAGLSHGPERYAARGVRADTPYPGLYVGGSELTVGDSYSASIVGSWLAANAVAGYGYIDHLYLTKNITTDLEQFLDEPTGDGTDLCGGVAVPYAPKSLSCPTDGSDGAKMAESAATVEEEKEAIAAESSKEE